MMFGLPSLLYSAAGNATIEETIDFCPQDLSVFSRSPSSSTEDTIDFCPQDLSFLNRSLANISTEDTIDFCPQDLSVFNRISLFLNPISVNDQVDRTEKSSGITITGTSENVADGTNITLEAYTRTYSSTVNSNAFSFVISQTDVQRYWAGDAYIQVYLSATPGITTTRLVSSSIDVINWYDATDASTMTLSGSNIDQVDDKGLIGTNHLVPTDATKPIYTTAALNGLNAITFSNGTDRLENANIVVPTGSICIIAYESSSDLINNSSEWSYLFDGISERWIAALRHSSNQGIGINAGANWGDSSPPLVIDLDPHFAILRFSATDAIIRVDGSSITLTSTTVGSKDLEGLVLAHHESISSHQFEGNIYEIGFIPNSLTNTEFEIIEGYFAHKYGLTANLPVSHPYKSSAPTWTPSVSL